MIDGILRNYSGNYLFYDFINKNYIKLDKSRVYINDFDNKAEINLDNKTLNIKYLGDITEKMPLKIFLGITDACNSKCIHCFLNSGKRNREELSTTQILKFIETMSHLGIMKLSIDGGEPLIRPDLTDILNKTNHLKISTSITTNGTLLNKDIQLAILSSEAKSLTISIDGADEETYFKIRGVNKFKEVLNNIKEFLLLKKELKKETEVSIRTAINVYNYNQIDSIYQLAKTLQVNTFKVNNTNNYGRAKNLDIGLNDKDFYEVLQKLIKSGISDCKLEIPSEKYFANKEDKNILKGCTAVKDFITIFSDGRIFPCSFSEKKLILGNIKREPLEKVLFREFDFNNSICNVCKANGYKDKPNRTKPKGLIL